MDMRSTAYHPLPSDGRALVSRLSASSKTMDAVGTAALKLPRKLNEPEGRLTLNKLLPSFAYRLFAESKASPVLWR